MVTRTCWISASHLYFIPRDTPVFSYHVISISRGDNARTDCEEKSKREHWRTSRNFHPLRHSHIPPGFSTVKMFFHHSISSDEMENPFLFIPTMYFYIVHDCSDFCEWVTECTDKFVEQFDFFLWTSFLGSSQGFSRKNFSAFPSAEQTRSVSVSWSDTPTNGVIQFDCRQRTKVFSTMLSSRNSDSRQRLWRKLSEFTHDYDYIWCPIWIFHEIESLSRLLVNFMVSQRCSPRLLHKRKQERAQNVISIS